ncbi:ABC transporter permease subunit [Brevibacterium sp. 50QC2O2]|jgi:polar amino acid transport system permease protein|nr:ABC transporter permease subunit [Brevibacterium sp. 50QC2O2]MCQ9388511.1 ABC transporter permease subunit [Brevibacterium sp. 50QC2O2]
MGMTRGQAMRWVIMPQAIRLIVPPTANQFISMLKNTSLVVVIAGNDLLTVTKELYSNNFLTMELLFVAAIWYLVLVLIFSWLSGLLERRYSRGA